MQKVFKRGMPSFIPRNVIPRAAVAPEPAKIISPGVYRPVEKVPERDLRPTPQVRKQPERRPLFDEAFVLADPKRAAMLLNACYYDLAETEKRLAGPNGEYKP